MVDFVCAGNTGQLFQMRGIKSVVARQLPAVAEGVAQIGKQLHLVFLAVCPCGGRVVARAGIKRAVSCRRVVFIPGECEIAEAGTAFAAVNVDFRACVKCGLRGKVVGQDAVNGLVVAAGTRQIVAAVVGDDNRPTAQGFVRIQRAARIQCQAKMLP